MNQFQLDNSAARNANSPAVAPDAPYTPLVLSLIKAMTWEEKLALLSGSEDPEPLGQAGYLCGVSRLGVPPRRDADGDGLDLQTSQTGIFDLDIRPEGGEDDENPYRQSTSFPSRIGVAATFDRMASKTQGMIEGREGRAAGVDLLYAPQVDICRLPNFGRNNTTFGEDPYLSGQMGIGEVEGIQSQGLMAEVKHFVMYNGQAGVPFLGRPSDPTVVDDYTLHELYLAPFEEIVKAAKPSSVMGSYQKFQVTPFQQTPNWACGNAHTLTTILRGQWDFRGFVLSDYGAAHAADELLSGLDQQFGNAGPAMIPGFGGPYFGNDMRRYVNPESKDFSLTYTQAMDRAVARVLYQYERFGLLAQASPEGKKEGALPVRPGWHKQDGINASQAIAEEACVLLKNDNHMLPLTDVDFKKGVTVIGPTGRQLMSSGLDAERSTGYHDRVVRSPLEQLRLLAPESTEITYFPGIDWMGKVVDSSVVPYGFMQKDMTDGKESRTMRICFPADGQLLNGHSYSWKGKINVGETGIYYFWVQQNYPIPPRFYGGFFGFPQTRIIIDGVESIMEDVPVLRDTYPKGFMPDGGVNLGIHAELTAGEHEITVLTVTPEKADNTPFFRLTWSSYNQSLREAVSAAEKASKVIIFADDNGGPASINTPTTLNTLAANQDDLIQQVLAANSNTAVIISSGNLVAMPWYDKTAAVMEVWYPGQEGGTAIANLLTGNANPSGHSPLSLPKSWNDTAFADHPERYLGVNHKVVFTDGIYVGYRWYDKERITPLVSFGQGLSYSEFKYSNLKVFTTERGRRIASFTVTNVSGTDGTAVPQVYVGEPLNHQSDLPYAVKQLAAFERVRLAAGESKTIEVELFHRTFEHWDVTAQKWIQDKGRRTVYLAESSTNIVQQTEVEM